MLNETSIELAHPSLSERIYQYLRQAIEQYELGPGTRLIDHELASRLGVSRTPVREAINRLAAEGLVSITPRRGAFVTSLSGKDILDLYQVREALEVLAVQLAVPRLTEQDVDALNKNLQEFRAALENEDPAVSFELDRQFHELIVEKSGNGKLSELNKTLAGSIQVTRWMNCETNEKTTASLDEHEAIVAALARRDAEGAAECIRQHIRRVQRELLAAHPV